MFIKTRNKVCASMVHLPRTFADGGMIHGPGVLCPNPQIAINKATGNVSRRCPHKPVCQ